MMSNLFKSNAGTPLRRVFHCHRRLPGDTGRGVRYRPAEALVSCPNLPLRVLLALILIATSAMVFAEGPDEDTIRSVRSLSNAAIKNHDIDSLRETWLPHLNVTTASGLVASSAEELAQLFTRSFSDPNFITADRTPIEIRLSPGRTYAAERGEWIGSWKDGTGVMSIEGIYLAQWHKVETGWRIRSELFVALSCDGSEKCQSLP
jgi:hypothetical protein